MASTSGFTSTASCSCQPESVERASELRIASVSWESLGDRRSAFLPVDSLLELLAGFEQALIDLHDRYECHG
jgi:hypothetical protein